MKMNIYSAFDSIKRNMKKDWVSDNTMDKFEFITDNIIEFCEELKNRREEGTDVIDEFTDVLCIKDNEEK